MEGMATNLCPKLRQSLKESSREYVPKHKKNTEKWLRWQFETRQRNEKTKVETEATRTGEGNVVALYFFYQSNSPRLWKTAKEGWEECPPVRSCRLDVVKYQLHIIYMGLGIEEAQHAYSKDGHTNTSDELFEHLAETAIQLYVDLKKKGKLPTVAPLKLPCPPNVATLGTMSELGNDLYRQKEIEQVRLKKEAQDEIDRREDIGEGDRWYNMQRVNAPEIENKLVQKKFRIKTRFSQPGDSGEKLLDWYHSTVTEVVNKNERIANTKWDDDCLHDNDMNYFTNVLLISRWNQKITVEGSWRDYLTS